MKYEIKGNNLPVVICYLEEDESMIAESGAMSWMSSNMEMETKGPSMDQGVFGRILTGETIFRNVFTSYYKDGFIAFSSNFPGSIKAVEIRPNKSIITQKGAFLASTIGIKTDVVTPNNFKTGFFSGEGYFLQKISGTGTCFLEIDGTAIEYELKEKESMIVDSGKIAMMDSTCTIELVKNGDGSFKTVMFSGHAFYHTKITGPGKVILQTMPIRDLAQAVNPYIHKD